MTAKNQPSKPTKLPKPTKPPKRPPMPKVGLGEIVVVRDSEAGVHFGKLVDYDDDTNSAILMNARRVWQWAGALSVHGLAAYGCNDSGTKCDITCPPPR